MKKQGIYISIIAIIMLVYSAISILLTSNKNTVFWIGYSFFIFSLMVTGLITLVLTRKRSQAFPIEISIIAYNSSYVASVFIINLIFGYVFKVNPKVFTSIQVICLTIFAILALLMQLTKSHINKQSNYTNGKIYEIQVIINHFEKAKLKLNDMPEVSKSKSIQLMDSLLNELRFSDFSCNIDVSDFNNKILLKAISISSEIDNLIDIQAEDLIALEVSVNEVKQLIQDRNRQIRLLNARI